MHMTKWMEANEDLANTPSTANEDHPAADADHVTANEDNAAADADINGQIQANQEGPAEHGEDEAEGPAEAEEPAKHGKDEAEGPAKHGKPEAEGLV
jgi:hypothetical protein